MCVCVCVRVCVCACVRVCECEGVGVFLKGWHIFPLHILTVMLCWCALFIVCLGNHQNMFVCCIYTYA